MPKVNVYPTPLPNQPDGADTRIEVGWSNAPTGHVQIATTKLQPDADREAEYAPGTFAGEPKRAWDGAFVELDRDQINQLIRSLRDARDKAFGRDE